jgi:hypothetical protein
MLITFQINREASLGLAHLIALMTLIRKIGNYSDANRITYQQHLQQISKSAKSAVKVNSSAA